jgi:hypothetical protein
MPAKIDMKRPVLEQANALNPAVAIPEINRRLLALIDLAPALLKDSQPQLDRRCSGLPCMVLLS